MRTQPMKAWEVMLNGDHIDTVFYAADCSESEVRDGLITYDHFSVNIEVREAGE